MFFIERACRSVFHVQEEYSESYHSSTDNLTFAPHASLNHTLCCMPYCSCSSDFVSNRLWLGLLKVHHMYLSIVHVGGEMLVHTYVN